MAEQAGAGSGGNVFKVYGNPIYQRRRRRSSDDDDDDDDGNEGPSSNSGRRSSQYHHQLRQQGHMTDHPSRQNMFTTPVYNNPHHASSSSTTGRFAPQRGDTTWSSRPRRVMSNSLHAMAFESRLNYIRRLRLSHDDDDHPASNITTNVRRHRLVSSSAGTVPRGHGTTIFSPPPATSRGPLPYVTTDLIIGEEPPLRRRNDDYPVFRYGISSSDVFGGPTSSRHHRSGGRAHRYSHFMDRRHGIIGGNGGGGGFPPPPPPTLPGRAENAPAPASAFRIDMTGRGPGRAGGRNGGGGGSPPPTPPPLLGGAENAPAPASAFRIDMTGRGPGRAGGRNGGGGGDPPPLPGGAQVAADDAPPPVSFLAWCLSRRRLIYAVCSFACLCGSLVAAATLPGEKLSRHWTTIVISLGFLLIATTIIIARFHYVPLQLHWVVPGGDYIIHTVKLVMWMFSIFLSMLGDDTIESVYMFFGLICWAKLLKLALNPRTDLGLVAFLISCFFTQTIYCFQKSTPEVPYLAAFTLGCFGFAQLIYRDIVRLMFGP